MISNYTNTNTGILIRFDDIAPNMNGNDGQMWRVVESFNLKPVMGVIPNNQDMNF